MRYKFLLSALLFSLSLSAQGPFLQVSTSGFIDCANPGNSQAMLMAFHNASSGFWTGPGNFFAAQDFVQVSKAGEYTFCALDNQGNQTCASVQVQQQNTLAIHTRFCGDCTGGGFKIGLDPLPPNYTGYWTLGSFTNFGFPCTGISEPGLWQAHAIDPLSGCVSTDVIDVTSVENQHPGVSAGTDFAVSCGVPGALNGSGANEPGMIGIEWTTTDGHFVGDPHNPNTLIDKVGTYVLHIWNLGVGCVVTDTTQVFPGRYIWIDTLTTDNLCTGDSEGSIAITPTTGAVTPLSYLWPDGATTEDRQGLPAGKYKLSITDAAGCPGYRYITVKEPDSLDFDIDIVQTSVTPPRYTVTLSASGGTDQSIYQYRRQRVDGSWGGWRNLPVFLNVQKKTLGFGVRTKAVTGCSLERTKFIAVQADADPSDRSDLGASEEGFLLYPNPAREEVQVVLPETEEESGSEKHTVLFYDGLGRLAKTFEIEGAEAAVRWNDGVAPGWYFVVVKNAVGGIVGKSSLEVIR